jgi:TRAP-type C4-dicarboxylate transport system permease small subunit
MNPIRKALDAVTTGMQVIAGACLVLMMVVVVLDVTLKYAINQPVPGTLEMVSFYFMAACTFLSFAYAQRMEQHIVMTLATEWMPPATLRILVAFVYLASAVYLALFAWASGVEAVNMTRVGESTSAIYFEILIWPARWSVPLGTGLTACWMVLQAVMKLGEGRHD